MSTETKPEVLIIDRNLRDELCIKANHIQIMSRALEDPESGLFSDPEDQQQYREALARACMELSAAIANDLELLMSPEEREESQREPSATHLKQVPGGQS